MAAGEAVLEKVTKTFFGPFRVSVLFDANGANTTAAAAVMAALQSQGGSLEGVPTAVLGGDRAGRPARGPAALPAGGDTWPSAHAAMTARPHWRETLRQTVGAAVTPFAASQ